MNNSIDEIELLTKTIESLDQSEKSEESKAEILTGILFLIIYKIKDKTKMYSDYAPPFDYQSLEQMIIGLSEDKPTIDETFYYIKIAQNFLRSVSFFFKGSFLLNFNANPESLRLKETISPIEPVLTEFICPISLEPIKDPIFLLMGILMRKKKL